MVHGEWIGMDAFHLMPAPVQKALPINVDGHLLMSRILARGA